MSQERNLLFITTSSLAANPRLVKEFETLKGDYMCFVLCFKHKDWSLDLSEDIKARNPEVQFVEIDRHVSVFQTVLCKITHKISLALSRFFLKNIKICALASNDKTQQLWIVSNTLSKKHNFCRVIAHNMGAFYTAVKLSEKKAVTLQLDIEDFHPGEALYFNKSREEQNRMQLMAHSFSRADAVTYASEGIQIECQKHFKVHDGTKQMIIINSFAASDFIAPKAQSSDKIKCVWFSQHLGPNRGLEQVFEVAGNLKHVEFHLIGNRNQGFLGTMEISDNIIIHHVMEQTNLHAFLASMDIGLALEPGKDLNNTIALSNKIMAYAQAGCYIVATDTFGQSRFLEVLDYNGGTIINTSLEDTLQNLDKKLLEISSKTERWHKAKSLSWEIEQLKLKELMK